MRILITGIECIGKTHIIFPGYEMYGFIKPGLSVKLL